MKIIILTSDPQSIFWHRLDLTKDFINAGCDVLVVSSGDNSWTEKFHQIGVKYIPIRLSRNGINPIKDLQTIKDFITVLKNEKPDKIFVYQAKAVAYGCLAAHKCGITEVYTMITGLGSILRGNNKNIRRKIACFSLKYLYKKAFKYSKIVFFQNKDDMNVMLNKRILHSSKTVIVNGSGVDLESFRPCELPQTPTFLFIGRLVKDKGICEYLEACKKIKSKYSNVRCMLVGPFDTNPTSIAREELFPYIEQKIIEYFGEQEDVRPFIAQCSTYILPSYHEGTPRSVLQAMAMGRCIIATDAPGCRETVVDSENGFLVPIKDTKAIVDKMEYLIHNSAINENMGKESRKIAVEKYDVRKVDNMIFQCMGIPKIHINCNS